MGRAVPIGGVSPRGVQAGVRGNEHRMWVTVVCFQLTRVTVEITWNTDDSTDVSACVCEGWRTNACKRQHQRSRVTSDTHYFDFQYYLFDFCCETIAVFMTVFFF